MKSQSEMKKQLSERALELYREQKYHQALVLYNQHLEKEKNDDGALKFRAHIKILLGYPETSLEDLTRAIQINKKSADLYYVRAQAAKALKDYQGVILYCSKALSCKYSDQMGKGITNLKKEVEDTLEKLKQQALQAFSDTTTTNQDVLKLCTQYLIHMPNDAVVLKHRADTQRQLSDPASCEIDCDASLHLKADDWDTLTIRGRARIALGKFEDALTDLVSADKLHNGNQFIQAQLGVVYENLNDFANALKYYQLTYKNKHDIDLTSEGLKRTQAKILKLKQDAEQAYHDKKYDEAKIKFVDYLKAVPNDSEALTFLADSKYCLGDIDGCIKDCDASLVIKKDHPNTLFVRGKAKFDKKDLQGALSDLDSAKALGIKTADFYYYHGAVKEALNRLDEALKDYQQMLLLDVNHPKAKSCADKIRQKQVEDDLICREKLERELKEQRLQNRKAELEKQIKELDEEVGSLTMDKLEELHKRFTSLEKEAKDLEHRNYFLLRSRYFETGARLQHSSILQEAFYNSAIQNCSLALQYDLFNASISNKMAQLKEELSKLQTPRQGRFFDIASTHETRVSVSSSREDQGKKELEQLPQQSQASSSANPTVYEQTGASAVSNAQTLIEQGLPQQPVTSSVATLGPAL